MTTLDHTDHEAQRLRLARAFESAANREARFSSGYYRILSAAELENLYQLHPGDLDGVTVAPEDEWWNDDEEE